MFPPPAQPHPYHTSYSVFSTVKVADISSSKYIDNVKSQWRLLQFQTCASFLVDDISLYNSSIQKSHSALPISLWIQIKIFGIVHHFLLKNINTNIWEI